MVREEVRIMANPMTNRQAIAVIQEKLRQAEEHEFHAAELRRNARADLARLAGDATVPDLAVEKVSPVTEAENLSGVDRLRLPLHEMGVTYGKGMIGTGEISEKIVAMLVDQKLNTRQRQVTENRNRIKYRNVNGKRYATLQAVADFLDSCQETI
mgnify:CR=1 FL=1